MFEEVDVWKAARTASVVTFYLVATVIGLMTGVYLDVLPGEIPTFISLEIVLLGLAAIFNLVFAIAMLDQVE